MAGAITRIPMSHRAFTYDARQVEFSDELAMSLSDTVFGFLHEQEGERSPESIIYNGYNENEGHNEDDEERENSGSIVEDNKSFWDNQHQLLQVILIFSSPSKKVLIILNVHIYYSLSIAEISGHNFNMVI